MALAPYGTPHFAIAAQSSFALVHLLIASYATDRRNLIQSLVFADWVFFTFTGVVYFLFRRRVEASARPYLHLRVMGGRGCQAPENNPVDLPTQMNRMRPGRNSLKTR